MNLSFEGSKPEEKIEHDHYLRTKVLPFSVGLQLPKKSHSFVIFGQPVEDRTIYLLERRPGCDLAVHTFAKKIHKTGLLMPDKVDENVNIVSFLDFYEKHPNKITNLDDIEFYREGIVSEVVKQSLETGADVQHTTFLNISGSINFGIQVIGRFLEEQKTKSATQIVKISPLNYVDILEEFELDKVLHLGLDAKFNLEDELKDKETQVFSFYDHKKGAEREIEYLKSIPKDTDVVVIIDCQVLASNYFQGTSVPFPFSYSISEIKALLGQICDMGKQVKMIDVCHFNPTVEDKRSAAFLLDFVHEFICSLNN